MSRPLGNPPPVNPTVNSPPPKSSYELPPLPPSPDEAGQQAGQNAHDDVRRQAGSSTQQKSGRDAQQKEKEKEKGKGQPKMKQSSGQPASQQNPQSSDSSSRVSSRGRAGSMVSMMVSNWDAGTPSSTRSGQGAGKVSSVSSSSATSSTSSTSATVQPSSHPEVTQRSTSAKGSGVRRQLGHARMASSPVTPLPVKPGPAPISLAGVSPTFSKPPSDPPPPLVFSLPPSDPPPPLVSPRVSPPSRSDVPPPLDAPPALARMPKVPLLSLAALGTVATPATTAPPRVPVRTAPARSAPNDLSMATFSLPALHPKLNANVSTSASASANISDDRSPPASPPTTLIPTSPRSPLRPDNNLLQGKDVKLELRYFIDGVLDHRIDPGNRQFAELLGELMVYVESRGGKAEIGSDARNSVMRGVLKIKEYTTTSGVFHKEVNVIASFSQPFMNALLTTGESEEIRLKLMRAFDKVAEKADALSQQGDDVRTSDLLKNEEFITLMKPIEQIFMDYVCGPERTLSSSRLPVEMKKLLLAIDKHLILWFEERGSDRPKDLLQLRQNAQIGYLATRSITAAWRNRCDEELGLDGTKKYAKMFAYLNACASNKLGDFVLDILSNQKAQPQEARSYVRAIQSPKQLTQSKGTTVVAPGSDNSVLRRGKNLQATSQLISPRSTSTSNAPGTSRTDSAARKLKKEEIQHQLARANFAEQIISEAGLKALDPRFMQYLKDKIVDMSRRGFDNFKLNPIPYCVRYAKDFYKYGGNVEKSGKHVPPKVEQQLEALRESFYIGEESGTESDEGTAVTSATTSDVVAPPTVAGSTTGSTSFVDTNVSNASNVGNAPAATRNTMYDDNSDSSVSAPSSDDDGGWGTDWSSAEES